MRMFPSLQVVHDSLLSQVKKQLRTSGFSRSGAELAANEVLEQLRTSLLKWELPIPSFLLLRFLRPALKQVHDA